MQTVRRLGIVALFGTVSASRCLWQIDASTPGTRGAALSSMERPNVRRAPQAIKHFEPVDLHDSSCIYIPYPVPKLSQFLAEDAVDSRVDEAADRIVEQRADDATTIADAIKHKPGRSRVICYSLLPTYGEGKANHNPPGSPSVPPEASHSFTTASTI